jgi:hypothetical protein
VPVLECSRCNELFYSASATRAASCERCGGSTWRVFDAEASFDRVIGLPREPQPADHLAIVYSDSTRAADFCLGFARDGLERGEQVVAVLPAPLRDAVEARLGPAERERLHFEDAGQAYADFDPERLTRWYEDLVTGAGAPVRVLAGPDGEAAAAIGLEPWRTFERLVHERIYELGVTALCVYDGPSLPGDFMQVAMRVHPLIVGRGGELRRNGEFRYDAPGQAA